MPPPSFGPPPRQIGPSANARRNWVVAAVVDLVSAGVGLGVWRVTSRGNEATVAAASSQATDVVSGDAASIVDDEPETPPATPGDLVDPARSVDGPAGDGSNDTNQSYGATGDQLMSAYEAAGIPDQKAACMVDYIAGHSDSFAVGLDDATTADMETRFALIDACSLTDGEVGMWLEANMQMMGQG